MSAPTRSHPGATVIATALNSVRVRLADNTELPDYYPSVLRDTVVGAQGVMVRLNQEDMVFVPYGLTASDVSAVNSATYTAFVNATNTALAGKASTVHTHEYDDVLFPLSGGTFLDNATYMGMKDGLGEIQIYDSGSIGLLTNAVGGAGSMLLTSAGITAYSNIDVITAAPVNASHLTRKDYVDALVAAAKPYSISQNASPTAENTATVGTYATSPVLRTSTLTGLFPEITTGTWDVDIRAHAVVYRSDATGGVNVFVGDGTNSTASALGRFSPQTHAYTLNVYASRKAMAPGDTLDMRYTGFTTSVTTNVVNHGWQVTARRA